ncbi:DUF4240 domain-containing protein [Shewanella sp. 3B26]|jgi:hypothetical protein|uniref:DUF4240 domain-containing protein n=1 Tax=Shewanella zhuhaiensis TaxID=2919576 RepID=A0AAJ1BDT7_9GAMM|nr:DUF4240 domain-containing protein [Shewanella zhuhaiensis]MCH4292860.1 DUF4240 domain-containing protein [Shewanella zhuhaiensis]
MTENQFWQLVTRQSADESQESLCERLKLALEPMDNDQLKAFDKWFGQKMRQAYTWPLWGAAYVVTGCDSDYGFAEFRSFLISLGQEWFERIVANPDALAGLPGWPTVDGYAYPFIEDYDLIAGQIFEDRTQEELPFVPSGSVNPAGKQFSTRPKDLKANYPALCQLFPF